MSRAHLISRPKKCGKLRLLTSVLALFFVAFLFTSCGEIDELYEGKDDQGQGPYADVPFMWLVTSPSGETMYIFGSVHNGTPEIYPLSSTIMDAFHGSDYLALEVWDEDVRGFSNVFLSYPALFAEYLAYTDGRTLADDLSPELYQQLMMALAEREQAISRFLRINLEDVGNFMPVLWAWVLWQIPVDGPYTVRLDFASNLWRRCPYGLDNFFASQARDFTLPRMPVLSIECPTKIASEFAAMTMHGQIQVLKMWLEFWFGDFDEDDLFDGWAEVDDVEVWRRGDDEAILKLVSASFETAYALEFWHILTARRDYHMANRAQELMAEGKNVFFVVGAMHLLTENNVIDLLVQRGYRAERIR